MELIAMGVESDLQTKIMGSSEELLKIIKDIESMQSFRLEEDLKFSKIAQLEKFDKVSFSLN